MKKIKQKQHQTTISFKEQLKHQSFCINNDVIIYFETIDFSTGKIVVIDKGKTIKGEKIYKSNLKRLKTNDLNYNIEIWKLYTEYYLKYN